MDFLCEVFYKAQETKDKIEGVDFATVYDGIPTEIGNRYKPTTPRVYKKLRKFFTDKEKVSLLDVGCGKGRMLRFFNKCGLTRVDGLEYSKELVDIAKHNMKVLSIDSDIYWANAAEWNGYGKYNFFYIFNSFNKDVMVRFGKKLIESYNENPRKITIIYFNPKEKEELEKLGFKGYEYFKSCYIYEYGEADE